MSTLWEQAQATFEKAKARKKEVKERAALALKLRGEGLTLEQIGERLKCLRERARQLCLQAKYNLVGGIEGDLRKLSCRSCNVLNNFAPCHKVPGIDTVVDEESMRTFLAALARLPQDDLLKIRNSGRVTVLEVNEWRKEMEKKYAGKDSVRPE